MLGSDLAGEWLDVRDVDVRLVLAHRGQARIAQQLGVVVVAVVATGGVRDPHGSGATMDTATVAEDAAVSRHRLINAVSCSRNHAAVPWSTRSTQSAPAALRTLRIA